MHVGGRIVVFGFKFRHISFRLLFFPDFFGFLEVFTGIAYYPCRDAGCYRVGRDVFVYYRTGPYDGVLAYRNIR